MVANMGDFGLELLFKNVLHIFTLSCGSVLFSVGSYDFSLKNLHTSYLTLWTGLNLRLTMYEADSSPLGSCTVLYRICIDKRQEMYIYQHLLDSSVT